MGGGKAGYTFCNRHNNPSAYPFVKSDYVYLVITVRKALPNDASTVCAIAVSRSRTARLAAGLTERQLEREGFLFYPLRADQYLERIEGSDHFWVAEWDGRVVAYCMAYTFRELRSFISLTENDQMLLQYFGSWGCVPACVYFAQAARHLNHAARGTMAALARRLPVHAAESGAPAILTEISLVPRNGPSLLAASMNGFHMVSTRTKTDPTDGTDRVSGTFMRILENKSWR